MNNNGIISKPISITDIKTVLQSSKTGLGSIIKDAVGRGVINTFSRHKPIRQPYNSYAEAGIIQNQWWQGISGDWGISIPWQRLDALPNGAGYGLFMNNVMGYNAPRGGQSEPYRIGDFDDYCHDSTYEDIGKTYPANINFDDAQMFVLGSTFGVSIQLAVANTDRLLTFREVFGFNYGLGVILQIPDSTDASADNYGYIYKATTFDTMASSMPVGGRKEHTDGTIDRISTNIYSININLPKTTFQKYVGKKIAIRPIITKGPISFTAASDPSVQVVTPYFRYNQNFSEVQRTYELLPESSKPGYVRPTTTVTLGTVRRSGTTITIEGFTITYKRSSKDMTNQSYQMWVSQINGVALSNPSGSGYNNYYTKTEYRNTIPFSSDKSILLPFNGTGVTNSVSYRFNDTITVVASGTDRVIISLTIYTRNRSVEDSWAVGVDTKEV